MLDIYILQFEISKYKIKIYVYIERIYILSVCTYYIIHYAIRCHHTHIYIHYWNTSYGYHSTR